MSGPCDDRIVLTAEQLAAVTHPLTPLRIVAGAGTGKTTVMAERIRHLVEAGLATPDQFLGLTFTNKAAASLKRRVLDCLEPDADVTVTTYHGFCAGLVAGHALELDLHPRTRLLNRAEAWQLLFSVFDEFRFSRRRVLKPSLVVNDGLVLASRCADHLVDITTVEADCRELIRTARWKDTRDAAAGRLELCQVVAAYDRRKRARRLIDFGDQIRLAVRLLQSEPQLAAALRRQHPVVLLDEYQDTNYAQRVLLELLYGPGAAITAVGDDMQSIYGFRGAHLRNILDFDRHFAPVDDRPLTENRRSGPALVALANHIQDRVDDALDKELRALPGAPTTVIECFLAADDSEEAATIAADIVRLGPPWERHAVLCRKRRLIPTIVAALEARAVPVEVAGASGLLDRPEIVDLVAWLELLADLSASVALLRILRGPRYRLGWRDLAALARHVRTLEGSPLERDTRRSAGAPAFALSDALRDLNAVADLSPLALRRLGQFCRERDELSRSAARLPVLDLAEAIVSRTGLWADAGTLGRDNLLRFLDLTAHFSPLEGVAGLPAFLEYLHLLDETEEDLAEAHSGESDAAQVMTIHQAKGLEWDHVWLPGLAGADRRAAIFPDTRSGGNALTNTSALPWWLQPDDPRIGDWRTSARKDMEDELRRRELMEEWRLLYVACTRARRRLVCSAAQWYPGPATPQGPSAFYQFLAGQGGLVTERFHHEPALEDPRVAAMVRRRAATVRPAHAAPMPAADQGTLFDRPPVAPTAPAVPAAVSVTGLVSYSRCPRQFYWLAVRPLPRRASAAARLGTEIHRWIKLRGGPQLGLLELEPVPDAVAEPPDPGALGDPLAGAGAGAGVGVGASAGVGGGGGAVDPREGLRAAFLTSPYATLVPVRVEAAFALAVAGRLVRGRIDAVYRRDGRLELVDFKTGSPAADGDRGGHVQLDLYALAAVDVWREDPAGLRTTYCYLHNDGSHRLVSSDWDAERLATVRAGLAATLGGLAAGDYRATPGAWCSRCEWQETCRPGRAWLARSVYTAVPAPTDGA
jgi:DNA helicase II / ATP-dependent DNA helicase PcrA